jgi:hypothetical protein
MSSLRVKKFNPAEIKPNRILFLIGRRGSGKSSMMIDILRQMPKTDFVFAMAPTDDTLKSLAEFVPKSCLFAAFDQEKLDRMLILQRELIERGKTRTILLILDDCLYQKGVLTSKAMTDVSYNGRHLNISLVITCQYLMDIPVSIRTNIDYVCTMRDGTLTNRQKLHKHFFGMVSFTDFENLMTTCTQNFSALILDCTISSTDPEDCIYWYRANTMNTDPFRLGRNVYWKLSNRCQRSDHELMRERKARLQVESAIVTASSKNASRRRIALIQTEDENGELIPST